MTWSRWLRPSLHTAALTCRADPTGTAGDRATPPPGRLATRPRARRAAGIGSRQRAQPHRNESSMPPPPTGARGGSGRRAAARRAPGRIGRGARGRTRASQPPLPQSRAPSRGLLAAPRGKRRAPPDRPTSSAPGWPPSRCRSAARRAPRTRGRRRRASAPFGRGAAGTRAGRAAGVARGRHSPRTCCCDHASNSACVRIVLSG